MSLGHMIEAQERAEDMVVIQERRISEFSAEELASFKIEELQEDSIDGKVLAHQHIAKGKTFIILDNNLIFDVHAIEYEEFFHLYYYEMNLSFESRNKIEEYNAVMFDHLRVKYGLRWLTMLHPYAAGIRKWKLENRIFEY